MAVLRWGAATDTGQVRKENEDAFLARPTVFVVADGMGGHLAGEVASAMAVETFDERIATEDGHDGRHPETADAIIAAVREANLAIFQASRTDAAHRGMGTTVTALAVLTTAGGERLALANVGDSRAYAMRKGRLVQLSVDHSYVQELIATGQLTSDEARLHPNRNIVTRALGIEPDIEIDAWTLPVVRGDRFLLCSDGLVDEVVDDTIAELLGGIDDPQEAADQLVATANRHGGRDNITVIVIDVIEGDDPPDEELDIALEPHWAEGVEEAHWANDDETVEVDPDGEIVDDEDLQRADATRTMELPLAAGAARGGAATTAVNGNGTVSPPAAATVAAATPADRPAADRRERPPSRFNLKTVAFLTAVLAVFVAAFTMTAAYARSGYFVGFRGEDVVVYKGHPGGVLWFDPTVRVVTQRTRDDLPADRQEAIAANPEFDSIDAAVNYVSGLPTAEATDDTSTTDVSPTTAATATTANPQTSIASPPTTRARP
jgi:protein phosphatase